MTPAPGDTRQQEYIITEMQLKRILVLMNRDSVMDEDEFLDIVAELRSRPAASQPTPDYCRYLKWLSQIEGDGDYRCELGNKTSCEWCEKKGSCGDYESQHEAAIRNKMLDMTLGALDMQWSVLKHSPTSHHYSIKRQLYLGFRERVESLRTDTTADKGGMQE